ncbi:hypothetical protein BKA62DRAFT_96482 [Auriculariales sp. MPI-PUGE-AT-0066]|nr:hypothetical protein BKA62DRAFT_96482 [Auriculariales sp. MPI-PUGE-AT-0066]
MPRVPLSAPNSSLIDCRFYPGQVASHRQRRVETTTIMAQGYLPLSFRPFICRSPNPFIDVDSKANIAIDRRPGCETRIFTRRLWHRTRTTNACLASPQGAHHASPCPWRVDAPARIKVSKPPTFCALPEQDELGSFTDAAPSCSEREDLPPRPGSRCDMALGPSQQLQQQQSSNAGPIRTAKTSSKSRTVRRQSGLITDMMRDDRGQRDRAAALGVARLPTPTSAEEMDISEAHAAPPPVLAPAPGSASDFDAFVVMTTPERKRKAARRLSGPTPSPKNSRNVEQDYVDEEEQIDYGLVLGRGSPLTETETETEPEPVKDERVRVEREREMEREAARRAARKREKEDRAREREEKSKERERDEKNKERERLRVERDRLRERKSAERLEQMEKEELAPPVSAHAAAAAQVLPPVVKDVPRVPFEPVTNATGALAPPTMPVKKRSIPNLISPPSVAPTMTTTTLNVPATLSSMPTSQPVAKPSRIPGLSLVVNGIASGTGPRSPTDSVLVLPSISLPVSRKAERLHVPVTIERERSRERELASTERARTPPPALESTSVPVPGSVVEDGRTRRVRSSVNYAEPKLNTKMRRPDPTEGGPAWPPTSRRKKSGAATVSASTAGGERVRVSSAEEAPREDAEGSSDDPMASRRHTIAI